jgi:hypothetical protein
VLLSAGGGADAIGSATGAALGGAIPAAASAIGPDARALLPTLSPASRLGAIGLFSAGFFVVVVGVLLAPP